MRVTVAAPLLRAVMRFGAIYCFIILFGSNSGRAAAQGGLMPAAEEGPCSLERASPAIVALVDEDFDLLLDDGRRVALAGLEFPSSGSQAKTIREAALSRLSNWLAGEQIFLSPLASGPDRWGRAPAQAIAAADSSPDAPLVSVGAALLAEGLTRFRPDPVAAPCAKTYLDAEKLARDQNLGVWISDPVVEVSGDQISVEYKAGQKGHGGRLRRGSIGRRSARRGLPEFRSATKRRFRRCDFEAEYGYIRTKWRHSPSALWATHSRARLD